jgi:pimeloyl-ACP methyl ester carboxylesterase
VPEVLANGVSLYYEEHGAGDPIVCLHGSGSSAAMWSDAAEELATRGRTIVYDRRGFSRSERPEPYVTNVHEQADDAAALIDALAAAPAIAIGRSYGGAVAIDLALRYPDRVRALSLLEGDAPGLSEEATRWLTDLGEQVFAAAEVDMSIAAETVFRAVAGDAGWEGLPEPVKQMFTVNSPAMVAELRGGFPAVTVEQLGAIDQPTLLVAAKESLQPGYAEVTSVMAAAMPSARVAWVEGGHLIDPAHPVVLGFVDEILARP